MRDNSTLLDYVEQLYRLESERYTLIQVVDKLRLLYQQKRNLIISNNYIVEDTYAPKEDESGDGTKIKLVIGLICIALGIMVGFIQFGSGYEILFCLIGLGVIIHSMKKLGNINEKRRQNEESRQKALRNARRRAEEIRNQNEVNEKICKNIEKVLNEYEEHLEKKNETLQTMYEYNIIHRNYRNFYGVSKIYHLLDTGICNSLTGVEGAYSQMRTDQIIDNQNISIQLQKELCTTNQMMYKAITQTNDLLTSYGNQMLIQHNSSEQLLKAIKDNVEMTNFVIQSGDSDRKALAQSAEYIAYAERQKRIAEGHYY